MESATNFYQSLTGISFTLLGLWFGVMQFGHGEWRDDPHRHRSTLHIALHFFLPGMLGLGSLLSSPLDDGVIWRVTFAIGASIGGIVTGVLFLSGLCYVWLAFSERAPVPALPQPPHR
ncbi:MAG: hypothetical protein ACR2JK_09170 [Geodermatophilaceae bacterium]